MKRISSGIPGLDELIEGGFPEGSSVLVAGGAGCGKTILGLQYLYGGALQNKEPGVFISLEEGPTNLWWNMQRFKWDLPSLERQGLLKIYKFGGADAQDPAAEIDAQVEKISGIAADIGAKRLVLDSLTALYPFASDTPGVRKLIYRVSDALKKLGCTTLLTCETRHEKRGFSRFGIEEFVADGILRLYFMPPNRAVFIRKMRGTNHSKSVHPFEISDSGASVNAKEEILWEALKD